MKSITVNPKPFYNAITRRDWFNDPGAVKDWDTTFSLIKRLGFVQVRYNIGLRDTFHTQSGSTVPFIFVDSPELWARRIEPIIKYCLVYKLKLLLVIDDVPECLELWGYDGTAALIQRVVDKVRTSMPARYTFENITVDEWQGRASMYYELMQNINFYGVEVHAPAVTCRPFLPWESVLSQFITSKEASLYSSFSVNIYVDARYVERPLDVYKNLLTASKIELAVSAKPYTIQETGMNANYAQSNDFERGKLINKMEKLIIQSGGFKDYGIYGTHDSLSTPPNEQFSIINANLILGYLCNSGYAPSIVIPSSVV